MSELPLSRARWFWPTATFGLLAVVFIDVEMVRWFRRTHDPAELLVSVGIAGALTGAYLGMVRGAYERRLASLFVAVLFGMVGGLILGWLLLLILGVAQLFQMGLI